MIGPGRAVADAMQSAWHQWRASSRAAAALRVALYRRFVRLAIIETVAGWPRVDARSRIPDAGEPR